MILAEQPQGHRIDWAMRREAMEGHAYLQYTPDGVRVERLGLVVRTISPIARLGLKALGLFNRGIANALAIRRVDHAIKIKALPPAFDGYRILHLSDLHLDALPGIAQALQSVIQGIECDVLAVTGDFFSGYRRSIEQSLLNRVRSVLRTAHASDGLLAVLGNHDPVSLVPALEALDFRVLVNEHCVIRRGREQIVIVGVDDVNHFYTPDADAALRAAPTAAHIALVHSPEFAGEAAAAGCGLYLCGHTHGGQIRLPGGYPLAHGLRRHRALFAGRWRVGEMEGLTSAGVGVAEMLPVRFFCPPQVHLITLMR